MVQSVHAVIFCGLYFASSVVVGQSLRQLDHFFPPAPSRFANERQRLPPIDSIDPIGQSKTNPRNPYLSQAYGGTWFRSNFQDLFSYRGAQKLEWFEVLEGNDCSPVPATVNAGRPPRDICNEAAVDERRCICINTGRARLSDSGYEQICGNCRDPCQLKFTPDKVPRYLQRLATQNLDENGPQSEFEPDNDYDY